MLSFRGSYVCALAAVVFAVCLSSCASVSVSRTEKRAQKVPRRVPEKIFVKPFGFNEEALRVDRSGESLERFKKDAQARLSDHLVRRMTKLVAPAEAVAEDAKLPRGNYWLVTGQIERLNQGSRLARSVVGLGLGGTKMETSALIWDLSGKRPKPFLLVQTTGGSGMAPGAIGAVGFFVSGVTALTSVANLLEGVRSGVSFDTVRTSRELASALSEYLYLQRAIPREQAVAPKRLGRWEPDFWPFTRRPERLPEGSVTVVPVTPSE